MSSLSSSDDLSEADQSLLPLRDDRRVNSVFNDKPVTKATRIQALAQTALLLIAVLIWIILILGSIVGGRYLFTTDAVTTSTDSPRFSGTRANEYLQYLTEVIGPRPVGSQANEVISPAYLVAILEPLTQSNPQTEIDIQLGSGTVYWQQKMPTTVIVYQNITNVLFRIRGSGGSNRSCAWLLTGHRDTVLNSPGATDDGQSQAVLLELARALSYADKPGADDLIFLFNGGEEIGLTGAHAFITQHPWRENLCGFINVDGTAGPGVPQLWNSGPGFSPLLLAFTRARYARGSSVIAPILFDLLPFASDWLALTTYGNLTGLDIGVSANTFAYHTALDNYSTVRQGSSQILGDLLLSVLTELNSEQVTWSDVNNATSHSYLDFYGLFMFSYPAWANWFGPLLSLGLAVSPLLLLLRLKKRYLKEHSKCSLFVLLLKSLLLLLAQIVLGLGLPPLIFLLIGLANPVSWYRVEYYMFCASFAISISVQLLAIWFGSWWLRPQRRDRRHWFFVSVLSILFLLLAVAGSILGSAGYPLVALSVCHFLPLAIVSLFKLLRPKVCFNAPHSKRTCLQLWWMREGWLYYWLFTFPSLYLVGVPFIDLSFILSGLAPNIPGNYLPEIFVPTLVAAGAVLMFLPFSHLFYRIVLSPTLLIAFPLVSILATVPLFGVFPFDQSHPFRVSLTQNRNATAAAYLSLSTTSATLSSLDSLVTQVNNQTGFNFTKVADDEYRVESPTLPSVFQGLQLTSCQYSSGLASAFNYQTFWELSLSNASAWRFALTLPGGQALAMEQIQVAPNVTNSGNQSIIWGRIGGHPLDQASLIAFSLRFTTTKEVSNFLVNLSVASNSHSGSQYDDVTAALPEWSQLSNLAEFMDQRNVTIPASPCTTN